MFLCENLCETCSCQENHAPHIFMLFKVMWPKNFLNKPQSDLSVKPCIWLISVCHSSLPIFTQIETTRIIWFSDHGKWNFASTSSIENHDDHYLFLQWLPFHLSCFETSNSMEPSYIIYIYWYVLCFYM